MRSPPISTLFPYTTLFRSLRSRQAQRDDAALRTQHLPADFHRRTPCRRLRRAARAGTRGQARPPAGGLMGSILRAALVQLRTPADKAAALQHAEPLVRQAAKDG